MPPEDNDESTFEVTTTEDEGIEGEEGYNLVVVKKNGEIVLLLEPEDAYGLAEGLIEVADDMEGED